MKSETISNLLARAPPFFIEEGVSTHNYESVNKKIKQ
jgi:hypothetical protein